MSAARHTEGPIHVVPIGSERFLAVYGAKICDMMRNERKTPEQVAICDANACHLALCWNSHDSLVAQRDALLDACRKNYERCESAIIELNKPRAGMSRLPSEWRDWMSRQLMATANCARAAIALAEKEGGR